MIGPEIRELQGYTLQVNSWHLNPIPPRKEEWEVLGINDNEFCKWVFDRDEISNSMFTFVKDENESTPKYGYILWLSHLQLYLYGNLKLIKYEAKRY